MAVEPELRLSDKFQALSDLITAQIVRGPVTFHTESFPFALNFLLLASTAFTFSSPCFTRPFLNTKPSIFDLELTVPQIPNEHCGHMNKWTSCVYRFRTDIMAQVHKGSRMRGHL